MFAISDRAAIISAILISHGNQHIYVFVLQYFILAVTRV